ncbi:MAG: hypothetical protein ACOYON_11250 [Fimbriimonas sp.]
MAVIAGLTGCSDPSEKKIAALESEVQRLEDKLGEAQAATETVRAEFDTLSLAIDNFSDRTTDWKTSWKRSKRNPVT